MARFLIRRILQGILVMWLVTVRRLPDLLRRSRARARWPGRWPARPPPRRSCSRCRTGCCSTGRSTSSTATSCGCCLHGNLGYSFYHQQSVNSVIASAFPITLSLVIGAAILWIIMGVLSGVLSAVRARSLMDRTFTLLALIFYSMPTFVLGLLLLLVFYYELTIHGIHAFPGRGTRLSPPARGIGSAAWSCPGSRWPWCRRPPIPGSPAAPCSTCWGRTTSAPPGPRACPNAG